MTRKKSRKYSNITLEKVYALSRNLNRTQAKTTSIVEVGNVARICGNSNTSSNYTGLRLPVNGLVLGKVSNIRRVKLRPLLDKL